MCEPCTLRATSVLFSRRVRASPKPARRVVPVRASHNCVVRVRRATPQDFGTVASLWHENLKLTGYASSLAPAFWSDAASAKLHVQKQVESQYMRKKAATLECRQAATLLRTLQYSETGLVQQHKASEPTPGLQVAHSNRALRMLQQISHASGSRRHQARAQRTLHSGALKWRRHRTWHLLVAQPTHPNPPLSQPTLQQPYFATTTTATTTTVTTAADAKTVCHDDTCRSPSPSPSSCPSSPHSSPLAGYVLLHLDRPLAALPPPFPSRAPLHLMVHGLAVAAAWRRQGVARELLTSAERVGRRLGVPSLWLVVDETNRAARSLYHDMGYQIVSDRGTPWRRQYVMRKVLQGRRLQPSGPAPPGHQGRACDAGGDGGVSQRDSGEEAGTRQGAAEAGPTGGGVYSWHKDSLQ